MLKTTMYVYPGMIYASQGKREGWLVNDTDESVYTWGWNNVYHWSYMYMTDSRL